MSLLQTLCSHCMNLATSQAFLKIFTCKCRKIHTVTALNRTKLKSLKNLTELLLAFACTPQIHITQKLLQILSMFCRQKIVDGRQQHLHSGNLSILPIFSTNFNLWPFHQSFCYTSSFGFWAFIHVSLRILFRNWSPFQKQMV